MNLLLDTNVAIWFASGEPRLPSEVRLAIQDAETVYVSAASLWEVAIKVSNGKLDLVIETFVEELTANNFLPLPVTWSHAQTVRTLPPIHRDPFDRLLVAQAIAEPLRFLTGDATLAGYSELVTVV